MLVACEVCERWRPAGAPECWTCMEWIEADIEDAWQQYDIAAGFRRDRALAQAIADDPRGVPWRVVDAAHTKLRCPTCGDLLGYGPVGCWPCDVAHGNRWLAAELDRPGVLPGNEHAVRVATAIACLPHRFPAHLVPYYVSTLPLTIAGQLPTTAQAQGIKAYVDAHDGDLSVIYGAQSFDEIMDLIHG